MIVTFRDFHKNLSDNNIDLFPYVPTLMLPHITEDGIVEELPPWYSYLFGDSRHIALTDYALRKYKDVLFEQEEGPSQFWSYPFDYDAFILAINESMYRYYDLFTQHNNPYHNVDENTLVTDTFGKVVTTHDFEAQKTKTSLAERVNEMQFAQDNVTTDDGVYGQNADVLKATNHSNVMTSAKTDTTTTNKGGSIDTVESDPFTNTDTVEQYVNTHKVERGGNIGVTTNKTLAFEQMEYASAMKLFDMFLKEYMKFFSLGVWSYE